MFVRLCSIEFDYVRLLNCSITESSIAFDSGTDFRSFQLVFFFSIKLKINLGTPKSRSIILEILVLVTAKSRLKSVAFTKFVHFLSH